MSTSISHAEARAMRANLERDASDPALAPDLVGGFDTAAGGQDVFTIRDLSKECGVTARTLRFYEEKGLLTPRRAGLDRLYSRRDRARLKYVLMGKRVGFSL